MNKKIIPVVIGLAVLVLCIAIFQFFAYQNDNNPAADVFEIAANDGDIAAYTQAVEEAVQDSAPQQTPQPSDAQQTPAFAAASVPARIENGMLVIGNENAPVTIHEFSSLSCPHCAAFHQNTLPALKKDYVDTGKVKIIFHDFPLNQQALHGTLLLQCVDSNDRYALMEMLFDQQAQWAFESDHQAKLKQYAALLGISSDKAEACMSNVAKEQDILRAMKMSSAQYQIQSTPSFVIMPDQTILIGSQGYGTFSTEIEKLLAQ